MPGTNELLGLLIIIFVVWLFLKMVRVAIRVIFFVITIIVILGAVYWLFLR
ncbi:MAG: hypothetical protein JJE51_12875 [Thermoanaerobaculia bacterium]|nr:hypothetical protein [Thermoanaerobaculia bacterium]